MKTPITGAEAEPDKFAGVKLDYSNGRGKYGKQYVYIRPAGDCFNCSRRVEATEEAILKCVLKYFYPVNYYQINGAVIGAKSKHIALKEYWRVCERADIGKNFIVNHLTEHPWE